MEYAEYSGMFYVFIVFDMFYKLFFYRGITVYIWNVEYSGMVYVLFHFCFSCFT